MGPFTALVVREAEEGNPKTATAADLMCGAPSLVEPEQLSEVHVASVVPAEADSPEAG